jgi:hypothetical protein
MEQNRNWERFRLHECKETEASESQSRRPTHSVHLKVQAIHAGGRKAWRNLFHLVINGNAQDRRESLRFHCDSQTANFSAMFANLKAEEFSEIP